MMFEAIARLGFFFRPFRRGAYRHAPSIEELYLRNHHHKKQLQHVIQWTKGWVRRMLSIWADP
jgi:hypothetical protein